VSLVYSDFGQLAILARRHLLGDNHILFISAMFALLHLKLAITQTIWIYICGQGHLINLPPNVSYDIWTTPCQNSV